ncbi:hypothetical protein TNCV_372621 [Trichonephila clavipes]|nr:hypothetical protein TNCV_372621 [Trichonephila clavipes]
MIRPLDSTRRFVPAPSSSSHHRRLSRSSPAQSFYSSLVTRYPRTALSDRWHSLDITSLRNIGGIRYVHIHSYIGHHDQACVLACKIQCISKFHEIKLKS